MGRKMTKIEEDLARKLCDWQDKCQDLKKRLKELEAEKKHLMETLHYELPGKYPDNCSVCKGANGGVCGNENVIDGVIMCDYCHAKTLKGN